ncbi:MULTISPECIES: ATP-dependent helicase [Chryseobacterium]|uniref:DNA 3'-5' helicase n=1 Tax=Chryseobacterium geocarposphaerae TaxID=1416776 RepID=A0ABU1LGN3_9FLAO|nr:MULTISPECIES: ATP-dependent helicase [Chryseobacterium]MDR6405891.1 DNA helicase-2/ATP-dependent DNA helicase PcrA [Chryseobacterium geocarposphaerae]MDR6698945.1 DNA helicase-2/ATP-dependent DNA helicase PcrA [Chryseobacterium ginsenosidimutans]
MVNFTIETLWKELNFSPNDSQREAILHIDGALYLTAGPGSGKTRVLLWRTLNLIVFYNVSPENILLTTFTEKAAHQLKEGLQSLLGIASNYTGKQYDLGKMFIGTVHSICNKIIGDRRFYENRARGKSVKTIDQLEQYFFLKKNSTWNRILDVADITILEINGFFQKSEPKFPNKHKAIIECIALFNRFSEERLDVEEALNIVDKEETLYSILEMYKEYRSILKENPFYDICDLSLLQYKALEVLEKYEGARKIFQYIIIDEYQDTNSIQEQLYFTLAGNKNICVVGDDDQALYRFRGSTVENFVEFPDRVKKILGENVTKIPLSINYRSKKRIVDFYSSFIEQEDWRKNGNSNSQYRVFDKNIQSNSNDDEVSIIHIDDGNWSEKVAILSKNLIDNNIVKDANQIAFLFPSLTNVNAHRTIEALRNQGLNVYAPRAGRFLEGNEPTEIFGIFARIFGLPNLDDFSGLEFNHFKGWLKHANAIAGGIIENDKILKSFVQDKKKQLEKIVKDYNALLKVIEKNSWKLDDEFNLELMRRKLSEANNLSDEAKIAILSPYLARIVNERERNQKEDSFKLSQIINRATSLDWSILDLFYQITGFKHFKNYFDLAQNEGNEGPICNLSKLTEYLARFMEMYSPILSASFVNEDGFIRLFFSSFLYTIYRLGESEYENQDDPFPKGNIQVLTIHQSKGLEFPVVFMYPKRIESGDQKEEIISKFKKSSGEPLEKIPRFDLMRIFYVGLSRAENLLILPKLEAKGHGKTLVNYINNTLQSVNSQELNSYDYKTLKIGEHSKSNLSKPYSYTTDYLGYERCPRQYMIFRKYGFVPSRSQTMFFGSLVHNTIEDLHQYLISKKEQNEGKR